MAHSVRRVLLWLGVFTVVMALLVLAATAISNPAEATALGWVRVKSLVFGALLGGLAVILTARSVVKSSHVAAENAHFDFGMLPLYSGLVFKLVTIAVGVFLGLVYFHLALHYIVLGYSIMLAAYVWEALFPSKAQPTEATKPD